MDTDAIPMDASHEFANLPSTDESGATEALLKRWLPKETDQDNPASETGDDDPRRKKTAEPESDDEPETEDEDETSEETPEEDDETEDEGEEDEKKPQVRKFIEDDGSSYVKIKVDGEEHEVPVKDLKRLYGQEASLTRKSQEVATKRNELDKASAQNLAAYQVLLERARERAAPFADIDFLVAAKSLNEDELTALRSTARQAFEEVQFLEQELGNFMQAVQQRANAELVERARATVQELADPEKGIPGWSEKLYDEIRAFGISSGLAEDVVNNLVDPASIRLLYKAMLYERGQAKAKDRVVTTKVKKGPKKVIKTTSSPSGTPGKANPDAAIKKLRTTGSTEAAMDAILARWESND